MGWLITGLGTLITSIIAFFGRKMVTVTGAISSFILLTAALVVCIKAILTQVLTLAVIPAWIAGAVCHAGQHAGGQTRFGGAL